MVMRRGEVWWVTLDPTIGSEIRKTRPALIISPDVMLRRLRTVIVAPLTSKRTAASFRPQVTMAGSTGLVLLDQIRTVDRSRLVERMGKLSDKSVAEALDLLRWIFTD